MDMMDMDDMEMSDMDMDMDMWMKWGMMMRGMDDDMDEMDMGMMQGMEPQHMDMFMGRLMKVLGHMKMKQMMMAAEEGRGQLCPHVMQKMCLGEDTQMGMKAQKAMEMCMTNATAMRMDMDMDEAAMLEHFKAKMMMKHCFLTEMGWIHKRTGNIVRKIIKNDLRKSLLGKCPVVRGAVKNCNKMVKKLSPDCIAEMEGPKMADEASCPEADKMLLKMAKQAGFFMCVEGAFNDSCMTKANMVFKHMEFDDMGMPTGNMTPMMH